MVSPQDSTGGLRERANCPPPKPTASVCVCIFVNARRGGEDLSKWGAIAGAGLLALVALLAFVSGSTSAEAHHLCGATGSSLGPFSIQTYEDRNYKTTYARAFELAGFNALFPEYPSFALQRLEVGPRSAGSGQTADPYIPPVLLKAIAFMESGWAHADYSVPYGGVGPALVSHDCGYGIAQVTTGMQNISGIPNLDQTMIGGHYGFNIARGAKILAEKWNLAPDHRPQVGLREPELIENWYYAIWGYNGFAFVNHPLNPAYSPTRPAFSCGPQNDGFGHDRTQYPYQELIFGCAARPPVRGGTQLWSPQQTHLPNLNDPAFAGPLSPDKWNACVYSLQCGPMDMPTPNTSNRDATVLNVTRAQVLGSPVLSLSPTTMEVSTLQPPSDGLRFTIANTGTGPMAWRVTDNVPWLSVSPVQGVTLGSDLSGTPASILVQIDASGLSSGLKTGEITIESLGTAGSPGKVTVNLNVFGDGTLLRGSDHAIYYVNGGLKRHIPNGPTFEAYRLDWGSVATVSDDRLNAVPTGKPLLDVLADGNLLAGPGVESYVMQGGLKRALTNAAACGYAVGDAFTLSGSMLASIGTGAPQAGGSCPRFSPPEGSLIRGNGHAVYAAQGSILRHIPNLATLQGRGFRWGDVNTVPDSYIAPIPRGRPVIDVLTTGVLIKGAGGHAAYVMDRGFKRHIASLDLLNACGYSWGAIYILPDETVNSVPTGSQLTAGPCPTFSPPDGALVVGSTPEVYYVHAGLKRHVPNVQTLNSFGLNFANLDRVPGPYVDAMVTGHPLLNIFGQGVLLKSQAPPVYVMDSGVRRHVASLEMFNACGYIWSGVQTISEGDLSAAPTGPIIVGPPCPAYAAPAKTLLKGSGPELYVSDGTSRRHIPDGLTFDACGYHWGNMNQIPDGLLATVPVGTPLTTTSCP